MLGSEVYLLYNNVVIKSGVLPAFYGAQDTLSSVPIFLNVGDTLAYAVGNGSLPPFQDTTALIDAQVAAAAVTTPEPSSFVVFAVACLAALAAWGWRRRICPA